MAAGPQTPQRTLRFGDGFELDLRSYRLLRAGRPLKLERIPLDLLLLLVERQGELVTREQIVDRIWGKGVFFDSDNSINGAVRKIRQVLRDDPEQPQFVQTVTGRGYRFIAPVDGALLVARRRAQDSPRLVETVPEITGSFAEPIRESDSKGPTAPSQTSVRPFPGPGTAHPLARRKWLAALFICGSAMATFLAYGFLSEMPPPRVTGFVQGTLSEHYDGFARIVSDGVRVYFLERQGDHDRLVQTSIAGGETHEADAPFHSTLIFDVSPNHTEFLIGNFTARHRGLPLWIWPVQGGSPIRVGDIIADDASWCLDGQHILYARDKDIHMVGRDGKGDRVLLRASGTPNWMRWAPDGSRFSFTVSDPQSDAASLWEASADGTGSHLRFPRWSGAVSECCGDWTPDGKYFVFSSSRSGFTNVWAVREKRSLFHWRIPEPVQLTPTARPLGGSVLTRDGTRAFVTGWNQTIEFVRYDLKSRQFTQLSPQRETMGLWFSEDGKSTVLQKSDWTLWRGASDGSQLVQLTVAPFSAAQPRWSPDGTKIAFEAHLFGKPVRAYVIGTEGGAPQELLREEGEQSVPAWSPDGATIAVALNADPPPNPAASRGVYFIDWKTRQASKVPNSDGLTSPMWSPDGKYFIAKTVDERAILLFDPIAQKWNIVAQGTSLAGATWSKDSRYLYFQETAEPGQPVFRLHMSDFKRDRILSFEQQLQGGIESCVLEQLTADGSLLIRFKRSGGHVYALDLDLP